MPLPNIKSPEEFEKLIAQDKLIVVDFYDVWCGPCKFLAPKMLFFAKTYPDVVFVRVDVDEVSDVADKYGVRALPTIIFCRDGQKLGEVLGADPSKIKKGIEEYYT